MIDDFRVVLRADAGEQSLLLGLGNTELVVGVLDVVGDILPVRLVAVGGADVVVDVVEVDVPEFAAPLGHRPSVEVIERLEPQLAHPLGLVLDVGDRIDDLMREALGQLDQGLDVVVETELVLAARGDRGFGCWSGHEVNTSSLAGAMNGS